jgi:hypothetical protein
MTETPVTHVPRFRLCDASIAVKLGITGLVLVLIGGLLASVYHLKLHHQNRDEVPGVSLNDVMGAYHGVNIRAPLLVALEQGHPTTLAAADRKVLVDWLNGGRISTDYDNLDLGDRAPAEIIARDCVSCHSEKSTDKAAAANPLDTFESIKRIAFSKKIDPPPMRILVLSTHVHALSLGTMSLVIAGLLLCTRLPRFVTHGAIMLSGIGLAADIASWWLAINTKEFVYVIIVAGGIYNAVTGISLGLILLDTWFPRLKR